MDIQALHPNPHTPAHTETGTIEGVAGWLGSIEHDDLLTAEAVFV